MQRATTVDATPSPGLPTGPETTCPVCGEPVRGIAAAKPGEHRFVGCDHYASARFLRTHGESVGTGRLRLGP